MGIHVSRAARRRYRLEGHPGGSVLLPDIRAARLFAEKLNQTRDAARFPERAVTAGQVNAIALINEIFHYLIELYQEARKPTVLPEALATLEAAMGRERVEEALRRFVEEFPPSAGVPARHLALAEILVLHLANANPAFFPARDLFDDTLLRRETAYDDLVSGLHRFFDGQPRFGPEDQNLLEMLGSPAREVPHSLSGQLEYIWRKWGYLLGRFRHLHRLLTSLDLIREEERPRFAGTGIAEVYDFTGLEGEEERFTPDRDWMPRLVLLAKNTYVWLDQLSRKYARSIRTLDQIPDEELDLLSRRGFGGLWLIGLWERSPASRKIKQRMGNPDALASAYSVFDYTVAADLGGEAALSSLRERAGSRGIRLASDMVPNHVGIDGRWVIDHPEWLLSLDHSPFPSYRFGGPDLSSDPRVGIFLEDHYYDKSDAAVVFKRVDRSTGAERYVYHGNDGTSTPWNDTAQLDHLNPEAREALISTILRVARRFPIIRFDAAMTLAKRHYQRLWFPEPGSGGAIPSRSEHALTRQQFDARMPREFWREVVERAAAEAPDTLLLAEAFWLMEGYFVRTLGMHRVYNSAFMNMLRDEENARYRSVIKNTLEFDPEILKRYVNFMSNPDEKTAVEQFGKGDKYFGICTLMATLPGLPMFGHGQFEGFMEKYGMEFPRAQWDEQPDGRLVERHEREISPLLHRRHLFAEVRNFLLYDFFTTEGNVNEDVFAYSNGTDDERALVIYHNRFASCRGWIRNSAAFATRAEGGAGRTLAQKTLGEGLGLRRDENRFTLFRDAARGLEYLRRSGEILEKGLYLDLEAYQCQVFLDFREVADGEDRRYARLASELEGRGVPSVEEAIREMELRPAREAFRNLIHPELFARIAAEGATSPFKGIGRGILDETEGRAVDLLREVKRRSRGGADEREIAGEVRLGLEVLLCFPVLAERFPWPRSSRYREAARRLAAVWDKGPASWAPLLGWLFAHPLGKVIEGSGFEERSRRWLHEWKLESVLGESATAESAEAVRFLIRHSRWFETDRLLRGLVEDQEVRRFLKVNRFEGILWFNQEAFERMSEWILSLAAISLGTGALKGETGFPKRFLACAEVVLALEKAAVRSGYQLEKLLEITAAPAAPRRRPPAAS